MNNQLKFKTRIAFIQVVFQYLSNKADIMEILNSFIKNYKGTYVDSFYDKKKMKFEISSISMEISAKVNTTVAKK